MSIREDEENQEVEIPDEEVIEVPDVSLDLEEGEEPTLDEEELE